jgi:serine/threonine protein kinase
MGQSMIGTQLGRWVIDRELGKGAMGSVYYAHAADAPAEIRAVKVLAPDLARDPVARQRFQRESDVLCSLDHPNIVRFDGAGLHEEMLYYIMEFINGPDCETRLREIGRWPWSEVLDLAIQTTRGLKYAHDQGIVHRDMKPANLLLATSGDDASAKFQVKIADFGVARMFSQGQLTGSGQFIGTALYMAPEQAAGKPATKRSDFYSLGCVMYTLLTGRPPFNGTSIAEMVHKHQFVQPERPARLLVDLPHDVDELIVQLLSKDPATRPADGSVLLKRLESVRGKLVRKHNLADTAFRTEGPKPAADAWPEHEAETSTDSSAPFPLGKSLRALGLLIALIVVVGLIVYKLNKPRMTAEEYFEAAKPLMESKDPAKWQKAWDNFLEPMTLRYPDHPYQAEVEAFRHQLDDQSAVRRLTMRNRRGEAHRFYEQGLARFQMGDAVGGRKLWEQLIAAFGGVESEQFWVQRAQRGLTELPRAAVDIRTTPAVAGALEQARKFRDQNQRDKAESIWKALEELYRNDPAGLAVLEAVRADREKKP